MADGLSMADASPPLVSSNLEAVEARLTDPEPMCVAALAVGPASPAVFDTWSDPEVVDVVAERLRSTLRPYDEVHRLSGGHLVVVLPTLAGDTDLGTWAGRLFELVARPYTVAGTEERPRVVLGGTVRRPQDTPATILARVDEAMTEARNGGGRAPVLV